MTSDPSRSNSGCHVLAVANQKGGVGKTTTTINLGTGLAQAGLRCLVVDIDPQGNASTGLGSLAADRDANVYDALAGSAPLGEVITPTSVQRLDLAPGSVDLSGIDVELVDNPERAHRLRNLIAGGPSGDLRARYDYILIDCPPSLNLLTINAIVASDAVLVPLQCEFFALEGVAQLLSTIRRVQGALNPALRIHGIVLTMYDRRNRLSLQVAEDVRENLGDIVYGTIIPRNVRLSEAPSHALPALLYDPGCAGSRAYRQLAAEVMRRDGFEIAA